MSNCLRLCTLLAAVAIAACGGNRESADAVSAPRSAATIPGATVHGDALPAPSADPSRPPAPRPPLLFAAPGESVSVPLDGGALAAAYVQLDGRAYRVPLAGKASGAAFTVAVDGRASVARVCIDLAVEDVQARISDPGRTCIGLPSNAEPGRPLAVAPAARRIFAGRQLTLAGQAAAPAGHALRSLRWRQIAGPAVVAGPVEGAELAFTAPQVTAPVTLRFEFRAESDSGSADTDTVAITVLPPVPGNRPPQLQVPATLVVGEVETVTLAGSASDPDGAVVDLVWSQLAGPAVALTPAGAGVVVFEAPQVGQDTELRFALTARDDGGAEVSATASVLVRDSDGTAPDSDDDGVADADDACPGTPAGAMVDGNGCAASQRDADGDGVSDAEDRCPLTPTGDPADAEGCGATQRDSDGDGVSDAADQCPDDGPAPDGLLLGADGCAYRPVRAGAASVDGSWHLGASAGQFSATGHGIDGGRGYDPHLHATRKIGADTYGSRIHVRALVVEGSNGRRVAVVANDLYLPNDLTRRRVVQLLREHDLAARGGPLSPALAELGLAPGEPLGLDEANVAMTVSHSHTSPFYSTPAIGPWIFQDVYDIRFHEYIARQMFLAIVQAAGQMRPVRVGGTAVYANDVRSHTYGAKVSTERSTRNTPAGQPHDYTTRQMYVLRFDDLADGSNYANWIILGVHPEWVWGEEIINGDLTHAVMRILDRETGALTIMSQSETGAAGPHKDLRAHDPHERREFQESNFAGADRAARLVADNVHRALQRIAGGEPWDPAQFAPLADAFDVDFAYQRYAPPVTRPVPGVSNCNADRLYAEANPNLVAVDELPECKPVTEQARPVTEPFEAVFGFDPVLTATQAAAMVTAPLFAQLADMGVPLPSSISTPSFALLEEQATVPIQAFRLGDIALTFCPCEQFTDPALNVISRLDRVPGNLHTGWDWDIGYAGDNPLRDPAANGDFVHGPGEVGCTVGDEEVVCPTPDREDDPSAVLVMSRQAFDRMKAQIHNDAAGWEELANGLHAESEPQDVTQIRGNFTHEEYTEHGYGLVVPVGMANDYWGYMPAYREYRAHDHYRKSLAGLGPHGADFLATRLTRLAASLNGGPGMPPSARDMAYLAEDWRAEAFARALGELGSAVTAAFEVSLPPDGGQPEIVEQPADIERFDATVVRWIGGSTWLGMPRVEVQRCLQVHADGSCGQWQTWADDHGEVPIHVRFLRARTELRDGGLPVVVPDPVDLALWRAGQFRWEWTAAFEAYVSDLPLPAVPDRGRPQRRYATPEGLYRFLIRGQRHLGGGARADYELTSHPFTVRAWRGIRVDEVEQAGGTIRFTAGPATVHQQYVHGADTGRPFSDGIARTVGPVDYPDTWKVVREGGRGAIPWVRNERNLHRYRPGPEDDQLYCHRCTFRPWAEQGVLTEVVVSYQHADGSVVELAADTSDGLHFRVPAGQTVFIAAGAMRDEFGNTNGQCFDLVGNACDADGDGVQRHLDRCPDTAPGAPVDADGCALPDADADGVADADDQCPGTAAGEPADATGCAASQRDGDGDGVADADDLCPDSPDGQPVDEHGCPAGTVVAGGCTASAPEALAYRHFIGSVHEHSGYSDGEVGTTPRDYYAAAVAHGMDFMAGTEHSDNARLPVTASTGCLSERVFECLQPSAEGLSKWRASGRIAAEASGSDFTAIRGFEWTSDRFGHINVLFSANELNAKTATGYALSMEDFWQWFGAPPVTAAGTGGGADGIAIFNHPGREDALHSASPVGDPAYAFEQFRYRREYDHRVVGIELFGKSDHYYDADNGAPPQGWYAFALERGWHLGPVGAEDEHGTRWAAPDRAKTVLIAADNTPEALREAFLARRFYALAHGYGHVRLHLDANGLPMGSRVGVPAGSLLQLTVVVEGLVQPRIELVGPGGAVHASVDGPVLTAEIAVNAPAESWRFARVFDGDRVAAVSAPVWFRAGEPYPPCEPLPYSARPEAQGRDEHPALVEACSAYGLPREPACDSLDLLHAEMYDSCMSVYGDAEFCSATGGNLHALLSACYGAAGASGRALCKAVDAFADGIASYCRQIGMHAGGVEPEVCALIGGVRISQRALAAFEGSWTARALARQYALLAGAPMRHWLLPATHNSYNATDANTPPTLSGSDANQYYRLVDQLRMGIRAVEIDVHWMYSPAEGRFRPTVCHATGPSFGCTTERSLRTELLELRAWLDANPDQVIVLDLENNIAASPDPTEVSARLARVHEVFREVLGDLLYTPSDHGTGCQDGLPLDATMDAIRAAGRQVIVYAGGCSGLSDLLFAKGPNHVQRGSGSYLGMRYPDDCRFTEADFRTRWTRIYEDATLVGAVAGGTSRLSSAEEVAEMVRCGVNMPSLDLIHPDDPRLPAMIWSWAQGEPGPDARCAVLGPEGRLSGADCAMLLPPGCRRGFGDWTLGPPAAGDAVACPEGQHAPPVNGRDMEALKAVAAGRMVWVKALP